jgi:hypothetical protein
MIFTKAPQRKGLRAERSCRSFQVSVAGENIRDVPGDLRLTVARTQED